jgi:DNA-binding NarL/FixJ family response regulator
VSASPPTPPGAAELRILIADDDPLVRSALRSLLADQPDLRVDGEAVDGQQAVELAVERRPHVVVLDEGIVGLDAVTVIERIRRAAPEVQVVVFSAVEDVDRGVAGLRSGAMGYLLKEMSGEALLRALRGVAHGEAALSRALTLRVVEQLHRETRDEPEPRRAWNRLTAGEWQVLQLLTAGATVADVSDAIGVPPSDVRERIAQVLVKLEVPTLEDAVAAASRMLAEEPWPSAGGSLDEVTRRRMDRQNPPRG